ncbi:alpha/beta hydrolase [Micromonospora sp. WMMD1128]|uniref:alpha/beta hydrolase n=1 Tax=Micromonospora sp. WMMD1128 TaxID=3015150 RepID=UPI00248AB409|nr:alpha/beta hydrolase [Micromonospora sp. WMMD1128]WBB71228.1 alpha/beta hydrolase [Micromonospora sp. WMMD1128]
MSKPSGTPGGRRNIRTSAADGRELPLLVFEPVGTRPRAGVVLFHGGALREGSAAGLAPHCRRLAAHGIFAVSAGYRLLGRGAVSIDDCIADVRRAVERFGRLAASRGLEARHLASGGSSAGAHLALVAAMTAPTPGVAGVVTLNPAGLDLGALAPAMRRRLEQQIGIAAGRLVEYSLIEFVRPGHPPMQIHHGIRDEVEPIEAVRRFRDAMTRSGNECTLVEYAHAEHGFHYPGHGRDFDDVVDATARFLLDRLGSTV